MDSQKRRAALHLRRGAATLRIQVQANGTHEPW
jgi:hypothetical protein